jgi:Putative transposase of IS4/5 family (DUF4096)
VPAVRDGAAGLALAALLAGAAGIGFAAIFVKTSAVRPVATTFWRVLLALPILRAWMEIEGRRLPKALVSEGLWEVIGPLLPVESPKPKGGRPRVSDLAALEGIVYVLRSGIPWRMLPEEFGCRRVTCWLLLRDWQ